MQRTVLPEGLLDQISREIPTTAPFIQGMTLQRVHHTPGKRDIDALRARSVSDGSTAGSRGVSLEALLQLVNKVLKDWHEANTI